MKEKELIGNKFYMLTVLKKVERPPGSKDKHKFYLCRCD